MSSIGAPFLQGPILFVAHNDVSSSQFGGIEVYLSKLALALKGSVDVFVYVPNAQNQFQEARLINANGEIVESIIFESQFTNWQLKNDEREVAFESLFKSYQFSLVHFHHLSGHPVSLMNSTQKMGVPSIFSFHDFFSVCHIANLIGEKKRYCSSDALSLQSCDRCLNTIYGLSAGSQMVRREYWRKVLNLNDALIFNTNISYDIVSSIYPEIANSNKVHILPVAIDDLYKNTEIVLQRDQVYLPLKVAILGNFCFHKGADLIVEAIKELQIDSIEFHVFGSIEERYEPLLRNFPNVKLYSAYNPQAIPIAAKECRVSLHLSIWPETYVLTLSEAWQSGLIPIVSDIGALGERVSHGINGFKIPANSAVDLIKILRGLVADPLQLQEICIPKLSDLPIAFMSEHIHQLLSIYQSTIVNHKYVSVQALNADELMFNKRSNDLINTEWALFDNQIHPNSNSLFSAWKSFIGRIYSFFIKY